MSSSKSYLEYVLEQLSGLGDVSYQSMMGEYILYYRGRIFGGIYDDRLLVKDTPSARRLMPEAPMELPYPGAKEMLLVEELDDRAFLEKLLREMAKELPAGKSASKSR